MKKRKTFTFPDGSVIEGFQWSIFGYWFKYFPDSGVRHSPYSGVRYSPLNHLNYTNEAITEAGITMEDA